MSDQERDKLAKATDEDGGDEVDAHRHSGRGANDEAEGGDDVEAHKLQSRGANDEDGGDDVEAHKMAGR